MALDSRSLSYQLAIESTYFSATTNSVNKRLFENYIRLLADLGKILESLLPALYLLLLLYLIKLLL